MSNKRKNKREEMPEAPETPQTTTSADAVCGAVAGGLGIILYVLSLVTPVAIYGLIGGIVCEIAACGLLRTQQKKRPLFWAKAVYIACCVLLALGVAFMIGGIIWASLQQQG